MADTDERTLGLRQIPQWLFLVVVALVQIGGTAGAARHQPERGPLGAVGLLLLAGAVALLPLRFRRPDAVLAGVLALTLAYWSLGYPRGPVFLALLLAFGYAVRVGHRRTAITSLVIGFVGFLWLGWAIGREPAPSLGSILALAAWLVSLFFGAELVRSRQERAREAARLEAEAVRRQAADERMRIARDLHDAVAHNMSLINIQAGVALHLIDQRPEQAEQALTVIKQASKEALVELRSILGVLRAVDEDSPRAPTPTLSRIDDLVANATLSGVDVDLDVQGDFG